MAKPPTSAFRHSCRDCSDTRVSTSEPIAESIILQSCRVEQSVSPEYQITANVWIRGILEEEYGVKLESIAWRQGGLEEASREERLPLILPANIDLKSIPSDRTLSEMLANGEIDALISARAPSCFLRHAPHSSVAPGSV
ncbi:MAG: hypothetical protein J2P54_19530 [Bradyrhizobiaceae bacterium]|nr:hypothetical protein [Bradyrhizobiaceae bacterium]